jgi:hypothetical protein
MSDPTELEEQAAEITIPENDGVAPDDKLPPGADPAARGSERAGDPPPMADAEALESALRDGVGFLGPADEYAEQRRQAPTEDGPGTSLG